MVRLECPGSFVGQITMNCELIWEMFCSLALSDIIVVCQQQYRLCTDHQQWTRLLPSYSQDAPRVLEENDFNWSNACMYSLLVRSTDTTLILLRMHENLLNCTIFLWISKIICPYYKAIHSWLENLYLIFHKLSKCLHYCMLNISYICKQPNGKSTFTRNMVKQKIKWAVAFVIRIFILHVPSGKLRHGLVLYCATEFVNWH